MKASVMPDGDVEIGDVGVVLFAVDELEMSGWSTRRMPMFAPRRVPPCLTASVAMLNTRMKLIGPLATPPVELTGAALSGAGARRKSPCRRRICG
jgi:hypothetical protein